LFGSQTGGKKRSEKKRRIAVHASFRREELPLWRWGRELLFLQILIRKEKWKKKGGNYINRV